MINDLDKFIAAFGIRYVFVESGRAAIESKYDEAGIPENNRDPNAMFWVELSWGSGAKDPYDFAFNAFADTLGNAMNKCIDMFFMSKNPQCIQVRNETFDRRREMLGFTYPDKSFQGYTCWHCQGGHLGIRCPDNKY